MASKPAWEIIRDRKRIERAKAIPKDWLLPVETRKCPLIGIIKSCEILSNDDLSLTDPHQHDAVDLLEQLASRRVTCERVVEAFCKRAAVAHQLTNCMSEIMFEDALRRAKWLDQQFEKNGKPIGPLHGLPVTFKDSFHVKGYDSSIGLTELCFKPAESNSALVEIFLGLGAVIIGKTTVPQTMLTADTDSVVFGRTVNAHNSRFGAGGSSGGEAVMAALGGSCFGVGNDGAGSVRMPAAVNGVIGYKPSGYHIPLDGVSVMGQGVFGSNMLGPVAVAGFFARSIRDVQLACRLVSEAEPWRNFPFVYPHSWSGKSYARPRVGIWNHSDVETLHPPVRRGLHLVRERLSDAGIETVDFLGPTISDAWELHKQWIQIQDLSGLRDLLKNEPLTETVKRTGLLEQGTENAPFSTAHLHDCHAQIARFAILMVQEWQRLNIDLLILPNAAHTAVPFDEFVHLSFTSLFNIIDWPAITLPLNTSVDRKIDREDPEHLASRCTPPKYNADFYHGLPLSVQLVGRRFEDEQLLAMAAHVFPVISRSTCI